MKSISWASAPADAKSRSCFYILLFGAFLICGAYVFSSSIMEKEYKQKSLGWQVIGIVQSAKSTKCQNHCRPPGSEALPEGIVTKTSNFEMRPLCSSSAGDYKPKSSKNLLAVAVGIKQKDIVNRIVEKFPSSNFVVMLFHYDGIVDKWRDLSWSDRAIHASAVNQTKWWFAKRFLHPDIVAEYDYVFLWDEDLGVDHFNPLKYLSIVKDEGLEISQPALDPSRSEVHHQITLRNRKARVHRRIYKFRGSGRCYGNSTSPPCVGWVEMMAPVFSRAAWRCAWYMIQNDLIHAWGLDKQLGYCAQGHRTKKVGVVDSEYIVHLGLPTLGVFNETQPSYQERQLNRSESQIQLAESQSRKVDSRPEVRMQSYVEMQTFKKRWNNAVKEDKCWVDPYHDLSNRTNQ